MEMANLTSTLQTIQMISIATYLQRLSDFMHLSYNLDVNDKTDSFAMINSFASYLNRYETNDNNTNFLTQWLMNENVDNKVDDNIKYNSIFKNILFNHIMNTVVFQDYGNLYGFLAEVFRAGKHSLEFEVFVKNIKMALTNIEGGEEKSSLNNDAIERIFAKTIAPLFPKSRTNLLINSLDFIYAQAGCHFYHTDIFHYDYRFEFDITFEKYQQYVFDDCLEIGLTIQQLGIHGNIDKASLEIFALPALLHYVYVEAKTLENLPMKTIISDRENWVKAYDLLFSQLDSLFDLVNKAQLANPKHQYYLALFNFKDRKTLAAEEIRKNCIILAEYRVEQEVFKYITNPNNYTCLKRGKVLLAPLENLYREEMRNFLQKYYHFAEEIGEEDGNNSAEMVDVRIDVNGKIFVVCGESSASEALASSSASASPSLSAAASSSSSLSEAAAAKTASLSEAVATTTAASSSLSEASSSSSLSKAATKTASLSEAAAKASSSSSSLSEAEAAAVATTTTAASSLSEAANAVSLSTSIPSLSSSSTSVANNSSQKEPSANNRERNSRSKQNNSGENLFQTTKVYCLSLLYSCMAGTIEGRPVNSSNCPVRGAIRFQDIIESSNIYEQLTTFRTRLVLSYVGSSLRTVALRSGLITALSDFTWRREKATSSNIQWNAESPKFPGINHGFEIASILGDKGLRLMKHLLGTIEDRFFVPYASAFRNISVTLNV